MKKKKKFLIALVQMKYFDSNKKHNLEKIKHFIALAKEKKAEIVCFPESCVHKSEILNINHKMIDEIREECKKNSIWCIINDDIRIKNKFYNLALLINRKGKIVGHYKKRNLYGDTEGCSPGKKTFVFNTDFAKIGIVTCWDLTFPQLFSSMKKQGAEIVFCPSQWRYEYATYHSNKYQKNHKEIERKLLKSLIKTRSFENLFFVALCNPVIYYKDLVSYSAIVSPHKVLNEIIDKEGLITAKIDLNEIKKLHSIYNSP